MKNYLGFFKTNRTLLGSVLVVSVGFLSVQVVNAGSPVIKGCVSKVSGLVRIASKCAKNENLISWNQLGVQGLPGIQGLQGDTGKQGDQGLAGPKGDTGLQGPQGLAGLNGANGYSGSAGPQGPAGKHLVVLDANGNLVGYPIDLSGSGDTSTVIGTQNPFTSLQIYLDKENVDTTSKELANHRISFQVMDKYASEAILGIAGAEQGTTDLPRGTCLMTDGAKIMR